MKNNIEIQILSTASYQQLLELRDEIRKIKGLENLDLKIPKKVTPAGTMSGGSQSLMEMIACGVLAGLGHFASEKIYEYLPDIKLAFNKVFKKQESDDQKMSGKDWEIVVSSDNNGIKESMYLDAEGQEKKYSNAGYSINPEKTVALLIGCGQYDDSANFPAINPAKQNLEDMQAILTDRRLMAVPQKQVQVLLNETSLNVMIAINEVCKQTDYETLFIYFTGHGQNGGQNELSIIAKDTHKIDDKLHADIPYSYVEQKLKFASIQQKIIIIDTCHSGLATQGSIDHFEFEPVFGSYTLASTSADESAYFKPGANNTYFTGYLIEAFRKGIVGMNELLSLHDLYTYTKEKLAQAKLPAPTCKSKLENIIAEKYFISSNPGFLLDARLKYPKQLYEKGDIEAAKMDYLFLIKNYPDNTALSLEYAEFERNTIYNRLVNEADALFYENKNYNAALEKYKEALGIKAEEHVKNKILECRKKELMPFSPSPNAPIVSEKNTHDKTLGASHEETLVNPKSTIALKPLLLVFILLASVMIYFIYFKQPPHNDNKENGVEPATILQEDTVKAKQASLSNKALEKPDSTPKKTGLKEMNLKTKTGQEKSASVETGEPYKVAATPPNQGAGVLSGNTYEEPINNNILSFSNVTGNRIHFEGIIADYPVSGEFIIKGNKSFKANAANLEGDLILSEDNLTLSGSLKIKGRDIVKAVRLRKKN